MAGSHRITAIISSSEIRAVGIRGIAKICGAEVNTAN